MPERETFNTAAEIDNRRLRSARAIAELIEQIARTTASRAFTQGLNPAHWTALRYLAQANDSARNVGSFAKFHMTTPSSASQTISALEAKGLVIKRPGVDSRQRRLELTHEGRRILAGDPINELAAAIASLPSEHLHAVAEIMGELTRAIHANRGGSHES